MKRSSKSGRVALASMLALLVVFSTPASSWAYWTATASPLQPTLTAGSISAPASVSCSSSGVLLGRRANVSWPAVSGASSYNVLISNADGSISAQTNTTGTQIALTGGVLNNLLGGLVAVLFGSGNATVSIQAVHPSGWVSAPSSSTVPIGRSGLLIDGLLGGVECK